MIKVVKMTKLQTLKDLTPFRYTINHKKLTSEGPIKTKSPTVREFLEIKDLKQMAIEYIKDFDRDLVVLDLERKRLYKKYIGWIMPPPTLEGTAYETAKFNMLCFKIHIMRDLLMKLFNLSEADLKESKK